MSQSQRISNAQAALETAQAELTAAQLEARPKQTRYFYTAPHNEFTSKQVRKYVGTYCSRTRPNCATEIAYKCWPPDKYLTHGDKPREISEQEYTKRLHLFQTPGPWYFISNCYAWRATAGSTKCNCRIMDNKSDWNSSYYNLDDLLADDDIELGTAEEANPNPFPMQFQIESQEELDTLVNRLRVGHNAFWRTAEKYFFGPARGGGETADAETSFELYERLAALPQSIATD